MNTLNRFDKKICEQILTETAAGSRQSIKEVIERFSGLREQKAKSAGLFMSMRVALDRLFSTTRHEYLDVPDYSGEKKNRMVNFLNLIDRLVTNRTFFAMIEPRFRDFAERASRPARVLELASGSGGLILDMAKRARRRNVSIDLTGSDFVNENVTQGNRLAAKYNLPVVFTRIDMFHLEEIPDDAYDFVIISQALHHFTLEEVAVIVGQTSRIATCGLLALDGRRGLMTLAALGLVGVVGTICTRTLALLHDALVSGMRFFSPSLLELTLKIGVPGCKIRVSPASFSHLFVEVRQSTAPVVRAESECIADNEYP